MKTILEQLSSMTIVVADTGDLDSIKKFQPRDATTNPSLILAAAKNPEYVKLIDKALENSEETNSESNYLKISNNNQVVNIKQDSNQINQYIKDPKLPLPNIKNLRKWINKDKKAS